MTDFLVKPTRWMGSANVTTGLENGLWGAYTDEKFRLICKELKLTYEDFANTDVMPAPRTRVIAAYMAKYLQERYDAKDPVLEKDGRLMWFTGVSWTSYVGVPWKPVN